MKRLIFLLILICLAMPVLADLFSLSNYNLVSDGGCTSWNTDKSTACPTDDTTPTVTFNTDFNTNCSVSSSNNNYTTNGATRICSTTGTTTHTCTLAASDAFSEGLNQMYAACDYNESATSDSGSLAVLVYELNVSINSTPLHLNTANMTVDCSVSDLGGTETFNYRWYKNETYQSQYDDDSIINTTQLNPDDRWIASCRASNGSIQTRWFNSTSTTIVQGISSCSTLDVDGRTYYLSQNLSSSGTCITISANNTVLDGQDYYVIGDFSANQEAIDVQALNNITVRNIGLKKYAFGIAAFKGSGIVFDDMVFSDVNLEDTSTSGFSLWYFNNSNLSNIYSDNSTVRFASLDDDATIRINNLTSINSLTYGLSADFGAGTIYLTNSSISSGVRGVELVGGTDFIIKNTSIFDNTGYGIDHELVDLASVYLENVLLYNNSAGQIDDLATSINDTIVYTDQTTGNSISITKLDSSLTENISSIPFQFGEEWVNLPASTPAYSYFNQTGTLNFSVDTTAYEMLTLSKDGTPCHVGTSPTCTVALKNDSLISYTIPSWSNYSIGNGTITFYLDGVGADRIYEYYSVANLTAETTDGSQICLTMFDFTNGFNFTCGNGIVQFNYTIANFTAIDTLKNGFSSANLFFRKTVSETITLTIDSFIDVLSATLDVTGNQNPTRITAFDNWNSTQTNETYTFSSGVARTFNVTLRESKTVESFRFTIYGDTNLYNLSLDICDDGTADIKDVGFFLTDTIEILPSIGTSFDCINSSQEFYTVPFVFNFTDGGDATISDIQIDLVDRYYASNIYIDVANDNVIESALLGEIGGTTGTVNTFSDNENSKTITNAGGDKSVIYNVTVPEGNTISSFLLTVSASSTNGTFTEDFTGLNDINTTDSTAEIDNFFGYATNILSGSTYIPVWVNSTKVHTASSTINTITFSSDEEESTDGDISHEVSVDGGSNWLSVTSDGEYTMPNPGSEVYWRSLINTNGQNKSYLYSVTLGNIDSNPVNLTIDLNNDGGLDYNGAGQISSTSEQISINVTDFVTAQASGVNGVATVPLNISFSGEGSVVLSGIQIIYSLNDIEIEEGSINSYVNNQQTAQTSVTTLNETEFNGVSYDSNTTVANDVLISSATATIKGEQR